MKKIFRLTNIGLLSAIFIAGGTLSGFAQNPCEDAEGITTANEKIQTLYKDKTIPGREATIKAGEDFLAKYGTCPPAEELSTWLKAQLPKMKDALAKQRDAAEIGGLTSRFDTSMKAKNWDDVYASGKEILAKKPDDFRAVELVLGSIGYDELLDRQNGKYSDLTLQYAKQSLADLDAGKEFKPSLGVAPFLYKSKEDAQAWMNLTIGSIYYLGQKNKQAALPYLYKATLAPAISDVSKNPNPYEFIGSYYFDELNKLVEQIQAKAKTQSDTDTPEVAQQKVDEIKKLVAMSNGTAERAMDAFSRAFTLGVKAEYKAKMKKNVADAYKLRFAKDEGVDAWIASAVTKPFVNPSTPIQPISDPEPVKTTSGDAGTSVGTPSGTGVGAANGSGVGAANGTGTGTRTGTGVAKPAATTTTTPVTKPATTVVKPGAKPGAASVSKVVKKKA